MVTYSCKTAIRTTNLLEHIWGCRSFLTPWRAEGNPSKALNYVEGKGKYYGRLTA
mgnify:CR=1 FL=1